MLPFILLRRLIAHAQFGPWSGVLVPNSFWLRSAGAYCHRIWFHCCSFTQVWPNHSYSHTLETNLHLPGAHQWSRIRASRPVQTLAATASRLTFAVLFSNVSVTSVCLLNPLTNWQHAGRSMGPSHQAYLAQATERRWLQSGKELFTNSPSNLL